MTSFMDSMLFCELRYMANKGLVYDTSFSRTHLLETGLCLQRDSPIPVLTDYLRCLSIWVQSWPNAAFPICGSYVLIITHSNGKIMIM